ncbi:sensor histidine kinase [Nonomuraea composti]|uniref:sensor histidine kinase n=1 Tax=Nonomuraea composti TaxID=2720023 RepID=UPI001980CE61|nr:ATP-binding protein [Nonomuraea sp. FMUSA5-5]
MAAFTETGAAVVVRTPEAAAFARRLEVSGARVQAGEAGELPVTGMSMPDVGRPACAESVPLEELSTRRGSVEEARLRQVVSNLVGNAVTHPPAGTPVRVGVGTDGGAGLGLAIVRSIVAAHGGRVELRSAPGRDAAFEIRLPAHPSLEKAR